MLSLSSLHDESQLLTLLQSGEHMKENRDVQFDRRRVVSCFSNLTSASSSAETISARATKFVIIIVIVNEILHGATELIQKNRI